MMKAEQFYIKKQADLVNQFIKLQIQAFEKLMTEVEKMEKANTEGPPED